MSARRTILTLLMLTAAGAEARADVSLTDQQTYAQRARFAASAHGAAASAPAAAGVAAGRAPRLIDATGLEWFINDEVNYATTSSAVGAASDAVFVGAVEATTADGGRELTVLADAFDGYNGLQVSVNGGAFASYNNVGPAVANCGGRQVVEPAQTFGGLQVSRKIYVPSTDGFARWANIVRNPTGAPQTITLKIVNDLGSDAKTKIGLTSSGDSVADPADTWVTTYEDFTQNSSRTPRLAHVLQSPGAAVPVSAIVFADGNDKPTWSYTFAVPAGGTVTVLNFAAGLASRADAAAKAAQLAALPPGTTACLEQDEVANLGNVVPGAIPNGPAPTGPGGLTITTPTTDASYVSTSPFISIGGVAGATRLTSVTWSTDHGQSGTAQGTTDWSIPDLELASGTNVVTVTAHYADGLPDISDQITINRGALAYQLPEGATGTFFRTDLAIANPNDAAVTSNVQFLKTDGTTVTLPLTLPALSRTTVDVNAVPGLTDPHEVSSIVNSPSGAPLLVERTMFWDAATSYGSHGATAIEGPRTRFLFGEGASGFFHTYVLLANANDADATATVRFLPESGLLVERDYAVPAHSRRTVDVSAIPELNTRTFSITVDSDLPIVAERSMYFGGSPLFNGGTDSAGVSLPGTRWYFAEGATGFFDTFFLIGNAGSRAATVTMTYQLPNGSTVTKTRTVAPFGRLTVNPVDDDPSLTGGASFAVAVTSDEPVTAERSMYWAHGAEWYEGHNAFGVSAPAMKWGLAEGRVGQDRAFHTYILIGNPNTTISQVQVTFLRTNGTTIVKTYPIGANSRYTLDVNSVVPDLVNEDFGAIVEVTAGGPVIVERSLYNAANGVTFAAGTNAAAIRLPSP